VNVPALNDSKYIGISVYIVVLMCIIGVGLSIVLSDKVCTSFSFIHLHLYSR
jgi:gamma-aminobutyric acid type B receptor